MDQDSPLEESGGPIDESGGPAEILEDTLVDDAAFADGQPFARLKLSVEDPFAEYQAPSLRYPIVAIGASAGGLQAFQQVLEHLDPDTGMAFILVTHLAPDQKSFLTEILERYTQMPVVHIAHGLTPQPNHIYVLMPNQSLTIHHGVLHVEHPPVNERIHHPIDRFFYSLAIDMKNHAIGVVLSGADSDGALGVKAIKGEGGIALVQTPESAIHTGMPTSSIANDHVDLVLPPPEIAIELGRIARQFTQPAVRILEDGSIAPDDEQTFQKILQLIRVTSGLDLRQYKPETIRRRIARRMLLMRIDHLGSYLHFLQARPDELHTLQEESLINLTRFFRDPGAWESLRNNVLPVITQDRLPQRPIRAWCAGCSSGEEAYSLAIVILEYLSEHGLDIPVQVFGTDASDRSIEMARTAIYPESIAADVPPERLRRYFVKIDRGYQLSKRVRDICIFARQNICNDPPFSHIDILTCRNVIIYFNQALQRQVMVTFHYAIESGGYMMLGMSEGLRDFGDAYNSIDRKHKIYMKTGVRLTAGYEPPRTYAAPRLSTASRPLSLESEIAVWPELDLQRVVDRMVLARFAPPALIIDERMNVLQSRGQTSQFMNITPGAVSWNILRVLKETLVKDVRATVQRAIHDNIPTTVSTSMISEQGAEMRVDIEVLPISGGGARPRCFLVILQSSARGEERLPSEPPVLPQLTTDEKDRLIAQLRQDLSSTRFHLQSLVEERDVRNQELVSANEEIQSANEELQSTNEELETTKEELQSANEELQTVNDELQQRNNVLIQTGNDLSNLVNSVNIPLLMLSNDLHIRQFTPPMQRLLSVRPADIGRAIGEIRLQLSVENIEPILQEVLETLGSREMEVQDRDGRWHLLRVRPYCTTEKKIEGLVVVLVDIDQLRRSQQYLVDARDFARSVVESVPVPIVVLSHDFTIRSANTAFRELAQMSAKELETRSLPDLVNRLWAVEGLRERLEVLLASPGNAITEFQHESAAPHKKTLLIKAQVLPHEGDRVLLLMIEDITLRRQAELIGLHQKRNLEGEVQSAGIMLSRTQEELRDLTAHLFQVQEEERQRVARELHDDICQRLSLLEMALEEMHIKQPGGETPPGLRSAMDITHALNSDVRQLSHGLHPAILSDLGLSAALKVMIKEFGEREHMPVTYLTHKLPESWSPEAGIAIYRIAQEALRNVAKHAGKTHVKVVLSGVRGMLQLEVKDFGVGFDQDQQPTSYGLGMISMQERARLAGGVLSVKSALGQGTIVTAEVPLERHA